MQELKLTDPIKVGYVAYHIGPCGKIDDFMKIARMSDTDTVERIIDEGWSFISRTKKYKKGQKASIPKSQQAHMRKPVTPPPAPPVKPTGICLVNKSPNGNAITCLSLNNAYQKLLSGMTGQDAADLLSGKLCVMVQIIKTPDQFKDQRII